MRTYPRLVVLSLAGFCAGSLAEVALGQEDKEPSDAAILARLNLIIAGEYTIKREGARPIGVADVALCLTAMKREDVDVSSRGCLGVARLARSDVVQKVPRESLDEIITILTTRAGHEHSDTSTWSTRALAALAGGSKHAAKGKASLLTPTQARRVVSKALAMAMRPEPRVQQSAGQLLRAFRKTVGKQVHSEIARTLLTAIAKHEASAGESAEKALGLDSLKGALAALPVTDPGLAVEIASLFLAEAKRLEANHWKLYSKVDCLQALARILPLLKGEKREAVFVYLATAAQDMSLAYSKTSGVRTPLHHYGADAIEACASALTSDELARAAGAIAKGRKLAAEGRGSDVGKKDVEAMFRAAEKAIAAREQSLK